MRKSAIIGLIPFLSLLIGCSAKVQPINRNYKGESANWTAYYAVRGTTNNQISRVRIVYKGSDYNAVGKVKYLIHTPTSELGGEELLTKEGFLGISGGSGNGAVSPTDAEITTTIE